MMIQAESRAGRTQVPRLQPCASLPFLAGVKGSLRRASRALDPVCVAEWLAQILGAPDVAGRRPMRIGS